MLTFCNSITDSCPLNTEILINFMSCCFHKKIKNSWCVFNYICYIIEYIPCTSKSVLIRHQWKLNLQFYLSDDWNNFSLPNSGFTSFFPFSYTIGLGYPKTELFWHEPLALNFHATSLSGTRTIVVFLKAIPSLIPHNCLTVT